ncbi:hypothetical protein MJO28_005140 [Puccinia striiformis f. sp. tritici]|uniref:Uncharacterized protein n=2 Tax=Puccinia striiformis f. sp. tritici TaxID=168172 RepID=A0A0L0UVY0_9BASI|nr:hypothetical protein MJO28_005140 [Puccinia striiformis f. sp. tritici]KAI7960129.1 hypothetical protein MJO29_005197 [Puccinia striiformis f. sp. tritici]KAI9609302.1 hypothetical protein H4Q26_007252 [Puccinia striiformis f. sp. tritici PST-130]KNE91203.1 hypothetical protein PSTG_15367 [Puccinia striiformis f. sp. tritici PST-78]
MNHHPPLRPVIQLLSSPSHLLFQLVRFTTLPYMIYQIINNKRENEKEKEQLLDYSLSLKDSMMDSQSIEDLFLISRPTILNRLIPRSNSNTRSDTGLAWQAEAMAQIVSYWRNNSTTNKSQRIHARARAFISNGPAQCECQRSTLPLKTISLRLDELARLHSSSTLGLFAAKFKHSLSALTILRMIDIARRAQRWDLVVLFLDLTLQHSMLNDPKLNSRRLGQVTALLEYLRHHGRPEPVLDPIKLWAIHFICQSIETNIQDNSAQWARINRLSLDVLTRFAAMPIGFDRRSTPSKRARPPPDYHPCLDQQRHKILLDSINRSNNELEFAVFTRERCERLLSRLVRLILKPQDHHHHRDDWAGRSMVQLRLLEYLARYGTHDQFIHLLSMHISQYPQAGQGIKLSKIILSAARRFKDLSENSELIECTLSQLTRHIDQRPVIDYMLRPNQPLSSLRQNLEICLNSCVSNQDRETRLKILSHVLFRASQLKTPVLALRVWDQINGCERRRNLVKVGRRTRVKLKQFLSSDHDYDHKLKKSLAVTTPVEQLSNQVIRSMIYVYKNLTHSSSNPKRNQLAVGKHFKQIYFRLSFKNHYKTKWPLTRNQIRSHLIYNLIKSEFFIPNNGIRTFGDTNKGKKKKIGFEAVLIALENSFIGSKSSSTTTNTKKNEDLNGFENLIQFFLVYNKNKFLYKHIHFILLRRLHHLESIENNNNNNNNSTRVNKLIRFYRFLYQWRSSLGGPRKIFNHLNQSTTTPTIPATDLNSEIGINSQSVHCHRKIGYIKNKSDRKKTCSRFWANLVASHSRSDSVDPSNYSHHHT